jgi:hypothetical protein
MVVDAGNIPALDDLLTRALDFAYRIVELESQ